MGGNSILTLFAEPTAVQICSPDHAAAPPATFCLLHGSLTLLFPCLPLT